MVEILPGKYSFHVGFLRYFSYSLFRHNSGLSIKLLQIVLDYFGFNLEPAIFIKNENLLIINNLHTINKKISLKGEQK